MGLGSLKKKSSSNYFVCILEKRGIKHQLLWTWIPAGQGATSWSSGSGDLGRRDFIKNNDSELCPHIIETKLGERERKMMF
jgi:hypothetical protein